MLQLTVVFSEEIKHPASRGQDIFPYIMCVYYIYTFYLFIHLEKIYIYICNYVMKLQNCILKTHFNLQALLFKGALE